MKICPVCRHCFEDDETACANGHGILVPSRHGTRLIADKYRLERLLGRGGMGAVYAALHVELDRPTAVKLLLPDFLWDAQALERFRREARAAARLNHPNIVDTYDYGVLPTGEAYIVMEMVEGQTLREYMDAAQPLPFREAAHIGRQIAEGVDVAHHGGIVHRDLKPSNIILARDHRDRVLVKVVDFGIAKLKELSTSGGAVTNTGAVVGTPRYMSPEQCAGSEVDARSDIYSLAVILFEMLAGRPPFDAPSATALALKQVQEPPPPLHALRPDAPAELAELVMHALAKDPSRRPQSAGEMARTLAVVERVLEGEDGDEQQTRDLSNMRPPGLSPTAPTSAGALHETGASAVAPDTGDVAAAPPPTDRAGTPTGQVVNTPPASQPEELTVAAASGAPPRFTDAQPPHEVAARGGGKRALTFALLALAAAVAFGAIYALTRRDGPSDAEAETSARPSTENLPAAEASPTAAAHPSPPAAASAADEVNEAELVEAPAAQRRAIVGALEQWVAATNARDVGGQLRHYAPRLSSFYLSRGVTREAVRAEKERTFGQADGVQISIADPVVRLGRDGRTAVVRFRKQFRIEAGGQTRTGEVLQELHWARSGDAWKITSERDLQVIR